jgi:hypothetical protein
MSVNSIEYRISNKQPQNVEGLKGIQLWGSVAAIKTAQQNQKDSIIRNSLVDTRYSLFQLKQGGFLSLRIYWVRTFAAMN